MKRKSVILSSVAALGVIWAVLPAVVGVPTGASTRRLADPSALSVRERRSDVVPHGLPADVPRADISQREFDFGTVEPLRTHRHTFEIHNTGTAPLTVERRGTTCKCLQLEVIDKTVPPGATGRVLAVWEAKVSQDVFRQRATIATNDPSQPTIDLTIAGRTLLVLAADPPELIAPRIKPNQPAHVATTIVSQAWDGFTIDRVESSLAGVTWTLSPAAANELERLKAKSGWRLDVTLPADMPEGSFSERLRLVAQPVAAEPLEREIPLQGKVLRHLAVYGKDIRPWGTIDAGVITSPQGYRSQFVVKVHDDEPELRVSSIDAHPSFVEARLEPYRETDKPGIYRLSVRIPPTGTVGDYRGENQGRLTLSFDHPRIHSLELGIDFIVPPAPTGTLVLGRLGN